MASPFSNRFQVALLKLLPARLMGRLIYRLTRIETVWFKNAFISIFSRLYKVNLSEAEKEVPGGYSSFNEFFTRKLKSGARSVDSAPDSLICPADGTIAQVGHVQNGAMMQAKGILFSAEKLLGDATTAAQLKDSAFTTIYLAPYNYHRLHMPLDGRLIRTIFIPGLLYSVNAATTATVPDLYAVNERLVCIFENDRGLFTMTLVGAMNVASISTAWAGEILPGGDNTPVITDYSQRAGAPKLNKGDYMGHFNMGSTVVLIAPPGQLTWEPQLGTGDTVSMGQRIGIIKS
ncbi:MAG: archaetidylserine decarboxylase [Gammaproteobacteria bacterium]